MMDQKSSQKNGNLTGALLIRDGNVCLKSIIEKFREILKISSEELDENCINLIFARNILDSNQSLSITNNDARFLVEIRFILDC